MDIDGHRVRFIREIPELEMNHTAKAYYAVLRGVLTRKRATFFGLDARILGDTRTRAVRTGVGHLVGPTWIQRDSDIGGY